MFHDRARIHVRAGHGGDGGLSFRREKFVPRGGPDGGDGGRGGDVVLLCDDSMRDLQSFKRWPHHKAKRGRHGEGALRHGDHVKEVAHRYSGARDFLFLGRGVNYPIALEGALKLKEISYIHAEGYPAGEMKHGPIALIDRDLPVVVIATPGRVYEKVLSNMQEVRARDGRVIAVAVEGDERVAALADEVLSVPRVDEDLSPLVNVVPLQLLAYWVAERRGCDIDQPRNLAKSVTVE